MPAESATGYSNNQLAQAIAERAGMRLAGESPAYVSASAARTLDTAVPRGARADARSDTITFTSTDVAFAVVAVPPGGPDMTFRIGGLVNPTLVLPHGATVHVEFINADSDQAHGWEVTSGGPPFEFGLGPAALTGALASPLGDPTPTGYGAEDITFLASRAGTYQYACPMPGHAQMGMHGAFIVR
jgi:rusticyanin